MNNSKAAIIVSSIIEKVQIVIGISNIFFWGLATAALMTEAGYREDIFTYILGGGGILIGVLFLRAGTKRGKLRKNFKKYVAALSHNPSGSIAALSASVGEPEDEVAKNLELMIQKKFFSNAFIDKRSNCLVIPGRTQMERPQAQAGAVVNPSAAPAQQGRAEMITVTCKGCGAVNVVPRGQVGECEYCGSGIKG